MLISNPNFKYLLLTGIVILLAILVNYRRTKNKDILEPFYIISGLYFLIFAVAPTVWITEGRTSYVGVDAMINTPYASLIFIFGYLSFSFVYMVFRTTDRTDRVAADEYNEAYTKSVIALAWTAFAIAFSLTLFKYGMQGISFIELMTFNRVETVNTVAEMSVKLLFLGLFPRVMYTSVIILLAFQRKHRWMVYFAYLICLNFAITSGWRNQIVLILLAPLILSCLLKNKRPKIRTLVLLVSLLFFITGIVGLWRGALRTGGAFRSITMGEIFKSFMVNIEVFFPFYHMAGFIPKSFPYQLGRSYLNALIQFIPRDLWPGKPYSPMKDFFIAIYGPYSVNGPAFPNIGEMYMDFGIPGVLILMGVFGLIAKKMYGFVFSKDKLDMAAYSVFLPYLFLYITRGHFPTICMDVIAMFGPIWIIKLLTMVKKKQACKLYKGG